MVQGLADEAAERRARPPKQPAPEPQRPESDNGPEPEFAPAFPTRDDD